MSAVTSKTLTCVHCEYENLSSLQYCIMCGEALGEAASHTRRLARIDMPEREPDAPRTAQETPVEKVLLLQFGNQFQSRLLRLPLGKTVLLGRMSSQPFNLVYDELVDLTEYGAYGGGVSRQHALLRRGQEGLYIVDLDSKNGTFVNRQRLKPFESYILADQEEIHLGYVCIRLKLETRFPTS